MKERTIKKLGALACTLAIFIAVPVLAMPDAQNSTDSTKSVVDTVMTTCDGQNVSLKGKVHDVYHFAISDDGNYAYIKEQNLNLKGELNGVTYVARGGGNGSATGKFAIGQSTTEFTSVGHLNLISNGANLPNLYVRFEQHVTINSNGDITASTYNFTFECQ